MPMRAIDPAIVAKAKADRQRRLDRTSLALYVAGSDGDDLHRALLRAYRNESDEAYKSVIGDLMLALAFEMAARCI